MTDLSPQAQAIVDAFYCELRIDYEHVGLAAALRALVIQLKYNQSCWDEPLAHMVLDARDILNVATELETL